MSFGIQLIVLLPLENSPIIATHLLHIEIVKRMILVGNLIEGDDVHIGGARQALSQHVDAVRQVRSVQRPREIAKQGPFVMLVVRGLAERIEAVKQMMSVDLRDMHVRAQVPF